jgi:hypothetical protein
VGLQFTKKAELNTQMQVIILKLTNVAFVTVSEIKE